MKDYAELEKRLEARAERSEIAAPYADDSSADKLARMETMLAEAALDREAAAAISDLTKRLEEAREALRPFAFESAADIRWIWTHNPEVLTGTGDREALGADFKGQCVGVVSGPWMSHTETPDIHKAVLNARKALLLSRAADEKNTDGN